MAETLCGHRGQVRRCGGRGQRRAELVDQRVGLERAPARGVVVADPGIIETVVAGASYVVVVARVRSAGAQSVERRIGEAEGSIAVRRALLVDQRRQGRPKRSGGAGASDVEELAADGNRVGGVVWVGVQRDVGDVAEGLRRRAGDAGLPGRKREVRRGALDVVGDAAAARFIARAGGPAGDGIVPGIDAAVVPDLLGGARDRAGKARAADAGHVRLGGRIVVHAERRDSAGAS